MPSSKARAQGLPCLRLKPKASNQGGGSKSLGTQLNNRQQDLLDTSPPFALTTHTHPPSRNGNNVIAPYLWCLLKLGIPSNLDHVSSFQRKTFLFLSLFLKPFSPQPSRAEQFPRRETQTLSDNFTALVDLSYSNPFPWTAAEWKGCKSRISSMCDQKSRDRAKLRLVTTNQLPDLPELHLQSLSALCPFSLKGLVVHLPASWIVSHEAQLQEILLQNHELPFFVMVAMGSAPCLASLSINMKPLREKIPLEPQASPTRRAINN